MRSNADLKSMYAIVTDFLFERDMVQSLMDSNRLVEVEWRERKPCCCRVIKLCFIRNCKTSETTIDSKILQHVQVSDMGR